LHKRKVTKKSTIQFLRMNKMFFFKLLKIRNLSFFNDLLLKRLIVIVVNYTK
jgi:hypothetical protein